MGCHRARPSNPPDTRHRGDVVDPTRWILAAPIGAAIIPENPAACPTRSWMRLRSFAPTVALLFIGIMYFGLMIDVGLFDPLIR